MSRSFFLNHGLCFCCCSLRRLLLATGFVFALWMSRLDASSVPVGVREESRCCHFSDGLKRPKRARSHRDTVSSQRVNRSHEPCKFEQTKVMVVYYLKSRDLNRSRGWSSRCGGSGTARSRSASRTKANESPLFRWIHLVEDALIRERELGEGATQFLRNLQGEPPGLSGGS
jgi:hypothetical protein